MKQVLLCVLALLVLVAASQADLADGMQRYYTLDNGGDDSVHDADAQVIGALPVNGIISGGYYFDGVHDNKIVIPYTSLPELSYSLWFNPDSLGPLDLKLFSFMSTRIKVNDSQVEWNANVHLPSAVHAIDLQTHTWYHLVVTQHDTTYVVYVNGVLLGSGTTAAINTDSFRNFIGNYDGTKLYHGTIDEVGVWSRVLNASEVTILYNEGRGYQPVTIKEEIVHSPPAPPNTCKPQSWLRGFLCRWFTLGCVSGCIAD